MSLGRFGALLALAGALGVSCSGKKDSGVTREQMLSELRLEAQALKVNGEKHDPKGLILPKDARKRSAAIQLAFFQTGGVGPNLGRLGAALRKEGEKNAEMIQIFSTEMARLYGVLDRILSDGREYLAGDYSIGDIMHYPWLAFPLQLKMPELIKLPRVVSWLERIAARPAVKKGMAVPA